MSVEVSVIRDQFAVHFCNANEPFPGEYVLRISLRCARAARSEFTEYLSELMLQLSLGLESTHD